LSEFVVGALVFVFRSGISRVLTMDIKDGIVKHYNTTDRGGMISPSGLFLVNFRKLNFMIQFKYLVSSIWDKVQIELQCCGVNSYEDWYFIENWPRDKW
jgi:tetraspanin-9